MTTLLTIVCCVAAAGLGNGAGLTNAKDSSSASSWRLDVKFHDPRRITLQLPGQASPTTYWYVVYEVTNNAGRDVQFYPSFRLVADTLQVVESGDGISPTVYDMVIARHRLEHPFLAPPARVSGPLLQGEANARASLAIFRDFDRKADRFTIYAGGFSGQIDRVTNPAFQADREESQDNPRFFILRKTLAVHYDLPGDAETRDRATPVRRTREWVMR